MTFKFSQRSLDNLKGVHPALVLVSELALKLTPIDFTIIDGLRTPEEQEVLLKKGASWTRNSRHLTGHAIDFVAWVGGVTYDPQFYGPIVQAFKNAAGSLQTKIVCGADWNVRDWGHVELDRRVFPATGFVV